MEPYPVNVTVFGRTRYDNELKVKFSPKLSMQRYITVYQVIKDFHQRNAVKVVTEFGCGFSVFLFGYMLKFSFTEVINQIDLNQERLIASASTFLFKSANEAYHEERKPLKVNVFEGNIALKDSRVLNSDVVVFIEVLEHLFEEDLRRFPETVFGYIKPKLVVLTTPNYDFNVYFNNGGAFRDEDHKFEFTKAQFQDWATSITDKYPEYSVRICGIGEPPERKSERGYCSQMAIFELTDLCSTAAAAQCAYVQEDGYSLLKSYDFYKPYVDTRTTREKVLTYFVNNIAKYDTEDHIIRIENENCQYYHESTALPLHLFLGVFKDFCHDEKSLKELLNEHAEGYSIKFVEPYGNVVIILDECEINYCD